MSNAALKTREPMMSDQLDQSPPAPQAEPAQPLRVIRAPDIVREQVEPIFSSPTVRVVTARVVDSLESAGVAVDQAHREAGRIVKEARAEAEAAREDAREQGRAEGLEEALECVAKARREYEEVLAAAEGDMLEMAFRLAQRIVGKAIELEPELTAQMVEQVLRHARGKREISVLVAPGDLDVLESSADQFARQVDGVPVHFEADASLERGSCVIKTESGRIDGRIESQLHTLQRALRGN
jgi:type III secretion protein L